MLRDESYRHVCKMLPNILSVINRLNAIMLIKRVSKIKFIGRNIIFKFSRKIKREKSAQDVLNNGVKQTDNNEDKL